MLALLGENGAGKSTLIKMLGGAHSPDFGEIRIDGVATELATPAAANEAGVGVIYQEFNLIPALSIQENIFLGRERSSFWTQRGRERQEAEDLLRQLGVHASPNTLCRDLSVAQQQTVEIAKAISQDVRILVMDEPSAALTPQEVQRLFVIIHSLKKRGIGIIYISHRLDEIFEIANRVMVLRDGEKVGERPIEEIDRRTMIEMMVGRKMENEFPPRECKMGEPRLQVRGLSRRPAVCDAEFTIHRGEVLGVTGLVGAGRTEMARLIFGADPAEAGTIQLDGKTLSIHSPRDAIAAGVCLLTEDRKGQGLVLGASVRENFGLPNLRGFSADGFFLNRRREREAFAGYVESLQIKIPHQEQLAKNLSGGNQQKVVLAKWLERNAEVVIFDEPTRGVDVGAKYEIYLLIEELAKQGKAILMISSELPEVIGVSDRILVMREGCIAGEIPHAAEATQEEIMALAVG